MSLLSSTYPTHPAMPLDPPPPPSSSEPIPESLQLERTDSGIAADAPLPVDPRLRYHKLANGMRCWVRPHQNPPGRVRLWMTVASGSLNETEDELGIAHFLEHLAFHGTAHFPNGTLGERFAALGVRFGKQHNAYTSLDQTTYILSLPDTSPSTLDLGLLSLSDVAFGMTLEPEAIEHERRVILEEMRASGGAGARVRQQVVAWMFPRSLLAERPPLGREDVLERVTREQLAGYYARWYRPDATTLFVVGDIDPDDVIARIAAHFGPWSSSVPPAEASATGIEPYDRTRAAVIRDPELSGAQVRAISVRPFRRLRTVADFRTKLVEELGVPLINRRLGKLGRAGEASYDSAHVSILPLLDACTYGLAEAKGAPDRAPEMLGNLLRELERVRLHGFLDAELDFGRKQTLDYVREAAAHDEQREAGQVIKELHQAITSGRAPMSGAQALELLEALLPTITGEEMRAAFARVFNPEALLLLGILPADDGVPHLEGERLLEVQREVANEMLAPPEAAAPAVRLLQRRPEPGRVAEREREPMGVLSATLENGMRVHVKSMNEEPGRVYLSVGFAGGRIRERRHNLGITSAASLIFSQPATRGLSAGEIRDLLAGTTVSATGWADEDEVRFTMSARADDFERGCEMVHGVLARPRLEAIGFERWQELLVRQEAAREHSVEAQLAEHSLELLSGRDPRFRSPGSAAAERISRDEAEDWLENLIAQSPVEVALVGDLDEDRALELVTLYLGSLSARPLRDPDLDALRELPARKGPMRTTVRVPSVTPRAAVLCGWRAAPWTALRDRRLLVIAEHVLGQRLRQEIREERGLTYSAQYSYSPSKAYPLGSLFAVAFYTDPERSEEATAAAREVVQEFAAEGPTHDELENARAQLRDLWVEAQLKPRYWMRLLGDLEYHGTRLAAVLTALDEHLGFQRDDVREAMQRYIRDENRIEVLALPVAIE